MKKVAAKTQKKLPPVAPVEMVRARVRACHEISYGYRIEVVLADGRKAWFTHRDSYRLSSVIGVRVLAEAEPGVFLVEPMGDFDKPQRVDEQVREFLRRIPKTEIHLHVEGAVRKSTLLALAQSHGSKTLRTMDDVDQLFRFTNLGEFIQVFIATQDNIQKIGDFELLFDDLAHYLVGNRIVYSEVFLAISRFMQKGFQYPDLVNVFAKKIKSFEKKTGYHVRILIDVGRTFGPESAKANLDRVLAYPHEYVIGIGLGGDEKKGPAPLVRDIFARARQAGLRVVAHAGEDVGPESIRDALLELKAERIGHGIAAIEDPALIKKLAEDRTPLEISLTSNVFTGRYTRSHDAHPVQTFFPAGVLISVNSDDPTLFDTDLSTEYWYFYEKLGFTVADLMKMLEDGVAATFHPRKDELWNFLRDEVERERKRFPLVLF